MTVHRRQSRGKNQVRRRSELNGAEASVRIKTLCPIVIKTNLLNSR
jgi:hypothetical protein